MQVLFLLLRSLFLRSWPFFLGIASKLLSVATSWLFGLSVVFILGFTDVGKEVVLWAFDGLLSVMTYIVSLIVLPESLTSVNMQSLFDSLPGQVLGLLGYCGIPQAASILAGAMTVRFMRDILKF